MQTFVMLSTLGPDGFATLLESPDRLAAVRADAEAMGVEIVAQYAMLGEWDFLTIVKAEDPAAMSRMATTLAARGTMRTRTISAIDADEYVAALGAT